MHEGNDLIVHSRASKEFSLSLGIFYQLVILLCKCHLSGKLKEGKEEGSCIAV